MDATLLPGDRYAYLFLPGVRKRPHLSPQVLVDPHVAQVVHDPEGPVYHEGGVLLPSFLYFALDFSVLGPSLVRITRGRETSIFKSSSPATPL